jgi:hypothetical protein
MRLLALCLLPVLALGGPIYVQQWPDRIPAAGGVCFRPSPAQCRAAGYELLANRPGPSAAEIAAQQAAQAAAEMAESNRLARVRTLVDGYHTATSNLCALAGIVQTTNELTALQIDAACFPLLDDAADNTKVKRNTKIVAMALRLENLARALEREGYYVAR